MTVDDLFPFLTRISDGMSMQHMRADQIFVMFKNDTNVRRFNQYNWQLIEFKSPQLIYLHLFIEQAFHKRV